MDFAKKPQSFLAQRIDEKNRMKDSVTGHRTGLTERLLKLFAPRPPLESVPVPPPKPKAVPLSGIAQYMDKFAGPGDPEYHGAQEVKEETRLFRSPELQYQARIDVETLPERDIRLAAEAQAAAAAAIREGLETWDPTKDPNVQGDPFKTLFVGRLSYDTSERKLRRELEEFGPIRRIRIVHDRNTGKPRGYAFVEFEHKNDMKQAYKLAEGRKVEDRRILVDVERGRAVTGWLSRRFGGGKGGESRAPRLPKDPRRLMVRRMIERYLQERERAKEPPPASPERGGAEARTAEAAPRSASRGREESGPRAPAPDRLPREVSRDRRSRSAERGRGLGRSSSPPTRPRERSADLASGDDSEREAGEIADAPNDFGRERSRDRSRNGHGDGERHSDRKRERDRSFERGPKRPRERERDGVYA
ncbi:SMP12 [Auxenochlorella protothecoides x Auxenochlorella symbiontica]